MRLLTSTLFVLVFASPVLAGGPLATAQNKNFWEANEFWSAILGAVIGGLIAFGIQIKVIYENRKLREEDRDINQKAMANSLIFKLQRIYSNIGVVSKHIEECYKSELAKEEGVEIWQILFPLANPAPSIELTSDEMSMLLSLKDTDVFNAVAGLDNRHNALMESVRIYIQRREALTSELDHVGGDGNALVSVMDEGKMLAVRPYLIAANSIASDLTEHTRLGFLDAYKALTSALKLLKEKKLIDFNLEFDAKPDGCE